MSSTESPSCKDQNEHSDTKGGAVNSQKMDRRNRFRNMWDSSVKAGSKVAKNTAMRGSAAPAAQAPAQRDALSAAQPKVQLVQDSEEELQVGPLCCSDCVATVLCDGQQCRAI